jgi:hypothetical protein
MENIILVIIFWLAHIAAFIGLNGFMYLCFLFAPKIGYLARQEQQAKRKLIHTQELRSSINWND